MPSIQIQENQSKQAKVSQAIKTQFTKFLNSWQTLQGQTTKLKYVDLAMQMINNNKHLMVIGFKDFLHFNGELATQIYNDYYRFENDLNEAFTSFMSEIERNTGMEDQSSKNNDSKERYQITFDHGMVGPLDSVRDLKAEVNGKLQTFKGTVTRTTDVKPQLLIGVFMCKECQQMSPPVPQQFKYTEPKKCMNSNCDRKLWQLDLHKSTFADFQKLRVQEDPSAIPPGAMPRSIEVIVRNDNTEKGQPGDICRFVGYMCVSPEISSMLKPGQKIQMSSKSTQTRGVMSEMEGVTGIKGIKELNYKNIFIATNIIVKNNQFSEEIHDDEDKEDDSRDQKQGSPSKMKKFDDTMIIQEILSKLNLTQSKEILRLKEKRNLYEQMAQSLFPSIYGHEDIKKALLLQLLGGIHKKTTNRISIRGDINVLLVGDPSTAKSQFLKCVNEFVPRSVYTNGKTTSAAGLTASVARDQNGSISIEAGALMLADNGICCIDEFDKMQIKDQVAIHEAMQQQTISIAKAGVHATLNARTSILAAANPLFGRYDKSKSLKNNIHLSAPIMSRFDLFFVLCDDADELLDKHLSQFIVNMHMNKPVPIQDRISSKSIRTYIGAAKKLKPRLTKEAAELLRKYYKELRRNDMTEGNNSYKVTVRQLESMIRLSEAYARLKLDTIIREDYVRQAFRLISCSIVKLQKAPIEIEQDEQIANLVDEAKLNIEFNKFEQQIRKKQEQKKKKKIEVSHQMYQEIQKNTIQLFKLQAEKRQKEEIEGDHQISQEQLTNYLLTITMNNNLNLNTDQVERLSMIIRGLINKMVKEDRILMVVQESTDMDRRYLTLHPNYTD